MISERTLPTFNAASITISKEEGLRLYEDMVLGRMFEDKCAEMYYRGKMFGFVHLYNGQEAVSTGMIKALRPETDYVSSTYRDHVHALSAGVPPRQVMAELFGKATGCSKGRGAVRCTCFLRNINS
jgi:pyruvate dehydrogenase E1 component alpha subunit